MHYAYIHKELNDVTIMRNLKNSFLFFVASSTALLPPFPPFPLPSRQKLKIVEDNEFFKIRQWPTNSENL